MHIIRRTAIARASAAAALLAACAPAFAHAAEPLWPLAERTCVTGSFGEHRTGHYHAGIDLSTNGRIGLPVRAVADGRVVRLRASPYGYGRTLYLDTATGPGRRSRQVVYAHLSDFAPRWRAIVEAEQERLGKFTVDIAVADSPRVAAGELLAYTGDTGGGPPHLHFEVRDGDAEPINPLARGWPSHDATPPAIRSLRLVPLGLDGGVDGGLDPVVVGVVRAEGAAGGADARAFRAARSVPVRGPVGVQVLASDRADGCAAPRAAYAASLALDGAALFATRFDSVSYFGDWAHVDVRYDAGAIDAGLGEFVRLYDPITYRGALPGSLEGEHAVVVTVEDVEGNAARCELRVERDTMWIDTVATGGASTARTSDAPQISWRLVPEGLIVRVERAAGWSAASAVASFNRGNGGSGGAIVLANADAVWFTKRLFVPWGGPSFLGPDNGGVFELRRSAEDEGAEPALQLGPFYRVGAESLGTLAALDGRSRVVISRGGVFGATLLTASGEPNRPTPPEGLALRAAPVRFAPDDAILAKPAEVRFAMPDSLAPVARRLAVYSVAAGGRVTSLGGALDAATGEIVATTRRLGTFALVEDASAPRLSAVRPAPGAAVANRSPRLSVRVAEIGEGLDDEGVEMTLDGARLIPEYDPEAGIVKARPKTPLAPGAHTLSIRLADKAGNAASITSRFTVSRAR